MAVGGWVAAALVVFGRFRRQRWAVIVGAVAAGLTFHGSAPIWLPYLAVGVAAAGPSLPAAVAWAMPGFAAAVWNAWRPEHRVTELLIAAAIAAIVFGLVLVRGRQKEMQELARAQEAAIAAERARALEAERRRDLAADLHDVLAHTLSGLIVTLQGAGLRATREAASPELVSALDDAVDLARGGLGEARSAVESLRSGGRDPGAADDFASWVDRTVERSRATASADVRVEGDPESVEARWRGVARAVVREGLTNSMRHAAGAPVRIRFGPDRVSVVSVGDPERFVDRAHPSGGHGLEGLAERARAAGADVTWGPVADGFDLTMRGRTGAAA